MPEDVAKNFALPNFTTSVPGMLRGILDNFTTTRDKIYLNVLGMKKCESRGVSTMINTGLEVSQYYNVFNYVPPIPHK